MPNNQKILAVESITEKFKKAKGIYFTDYMGLKGNEITEFRTKCRDKGVEFQVVKNTFAKLSAEKVGIKGLDSFLTGPTAIAFSYDDPIAPAKVLKEFKSPRGLPAIKIFLFEGQLMDKNEFEAVVKLPTRKELLAKLTGTLMAPLHKLSATLRSPLLNLSYALQSLIKVKSQ